MTKEEYELKFQQNYHLSGYGLDTTAHMPCPFCAEPDFMVYKIMEIQEEMRKEHICKACGRGTIGVITPVAGGAKMEIVQTQGDDPPDYVGKMRRV